MTNESSNTQAHTSNVLNDEIKKMSRKKMKNDIQGKQLVTFSKQPTSVLTLNLLFVFIMLGIIPLHAQDALFTNYQNTPMQTNPALVTFDNDFKLSLQYRGRVSKFAQSYNIPVLSVTYPLINQEKSKRWGGLGFSVVSDMSGNLGIIKTTGSNLAFAYCFQLTDNQYISSSLGAGYFRREVNLNNLTTGSQYIPNQGFDPSIPNNEIYVNTTKGYLDLSSGLVWQLIDKTGGTKAFVGVSVFHLNKADISFNDQEEELPIRAGFQIAYKVIGNDKLRIFPDASLDYQTKIIRYNLGVRVAIPLKAIEKGYMKNAELAFSPRYLSDNLASLGVEFQKPGYTISFTYDFGVANKPTNTNVVNAYEIHFGYRKTLMKKSRKKEKIITDENYIVGEDRFFNKNKEVVIVRDTVYIQDTNKIVEKEWSEKLSDPKRKITFNYKSDKFEEEAKKELDEIITLLENNKDFVLEIEGHTDNIGDDQSNKRQSLRRAQAISDYLVKHGVVRSRIRVSGRGASKPVATNATEEGRAKNRRVEFSLYRVIK